MNSFPRFAYRNPKFFSQMSQAIFHEHGATQDAVTSVITGAILARDSKDFAVVAGNRVILYSIRSDSETSAHFKYAHFVLASRIKK